MFIRIYLPFFERDTDADKIVIDEQEKSYNKIPRDLYICAVHFGHFYAASCCASACALNPLYPPPGWEPAAASPWNPCALRARLAGRGSSGSAHSCRRGAGRAGPHPRGAPRRRHRLRVERRPAPAARRIWLRSRPFVGRAVGGMESTGTRT